MSVESSWFHSLPTTPPCFPVWPRAVCPQALEEENRALHQKVHSLQQLLQDSRTVHDADRDELTNMQEQLGSKITELYEFHEQMLANLRKESNS